MMDTFLNVGINEDIVRGMIAQTGQAWFAWDCYRRFLQTYGMAFGLARDDFDAIIGDFKLRLGVPIKRELSGEQMKAVAMAYRDFLRGRDVGIVDSPFEQLLVAVGKVFDSWNSDKAETYRRIIGISDDWGTAVTVQTMVFGNCSSGSGAGVVFTHSPRLVGDTVRLWGDFTVGNQGEDVVSGLVNTLPISRKQAEMENRVGDVTLETRFPEIYAEILRLTENLIYDMKWGPQEIEFTFESPSKADLYFLQTRDMGIRGRKKVLAFASGAETQSRLLGQAIGVSGGAMSGRVVYSSEEIRLWREREPQTQLILVRGDTVPDDIKEIHEADGLLTARGGSTSHAAIVAHRLGKTCLVGCADLNCMEKQSACSLNGVRLQSGDWISIDGRKGTVYRGILEIREAGADALL
jgi:pyruvate,orthophosphate dikinase